ncbi:hypothetical protein BDN67DRAFT_973060 [Paxillus ammoniavirescens]|nr:hypothetical protein BDN67DRAFT_973060 [Paxillus ammoniavirescens]
MSLAGKGLVFVVVLSARAPYSILFQGNCWAIAIFSETRSTLEAIMPLEVSKPKRLGAMAVFSRNSSPDKATHLLINL